MIKELRFGLLNKKIEECVLERNRMSDELLPYQ